MATFINNFQNLADFLKKSANQAVIETAESIVEETQRTAPRKTGELAESYTYQQTGENQVEIGSPLPYAIDSEFGTIHATAHPHLRPALDQAKEKLTRKVKEKLK